jgi:hypothetical protein
VTSAPGVRAAREDGEDAVVEVGSGTYRFEYAAPPRLAAPAGER